MLFFIIASHGDMQSIQDEVSVDEVEETTDGASTGSGLLCFVFSLLVVFLFFSFSFFFLHCSLPFTKLSKV